MKNQCTTATSRQYEQYQSTRKGQRHRWLLCAVLCAVLCALCLSGTGQAQNLEPRTLAKQAFDFTFEAGILLFAPGTPLGDKGVLAITQADGSIELWNPRDGTKLRTLSGLPATAQQMAFSSDGKLLAAVALLRDQNKKFTGTQINVWDITTGKRMADLSGPNGGVQTMAFRQNNRILAVAGGHDEGEAGLKRTGNRYNSIVQLFDVATGRETGRFDASVLAFAPDGVTIARSWGTIPSTTGQPGAPPQAIVKIWDSIGAESAPPTPRGEVRPVPPGVTTQGGHDYEVLRAVFSPDARLLATAGNSDVKVWDVATGALKVQLEGVGGRGAQLVFSASGMRLAVISGPTATLLDTRSGDVLAGVQAPQERGAAGKPSQGTLSASGKLLAFSVPTAPAERAILLFDLAGVPELGQPSPRDPSDPPGVRTLRAPGGASGVAWSNDGRYIAATGGALLHIWRVADGTRLRSPSGADFAGSVAWSKDGKMVLTGGQSNNTARLWDTVTWAPPRILGMHEWPINTVALSPDAKLAAAGGSGFTGSTRKASLGLISLWNTVGGARLKTLTATSNRVNALAFSPDGKWLADGCYDGGVDLWNVSKTLNDPDPDGGQPAQTFKSDQGGFDGAATITGIAFGRDELWAAQNEGTIRIYKLQNGLSPSLKAARTISLRQGSMVENNVILAFALAPDYRTFAVAAEKGYEGPGTVALRDAVDGKILKTLELPKRARSLAFSPDGQQLAISVADGSLKLWQVKGKP